MVRCVGREEGRVTCGGMEQGGLFKNMRSKVEMMVENININQVCQP